MSSPKAAPIPAQPQRRNDPWYAPVSVDMLLKVLNITILHPFVAWIVPLCFRAEHHAWDTTPMLISIAWASLLTLFTLGDKFSHKLAYGLHREVDLGEEVIVVTGGASGLGLLVAEVYGMRGATVAVLDVADQLENPEARGITYYKCDIGDRKRLAEVAAEIERDLGTPTILINNAAQVIGKNLLDMSMDEVERSLRTNLLSHFFTIKTFLPGMLASECGGTIVTMSSVLGTLGAAQLSDYTAAKAGAAALHRSLAAELRQSGDHEKVKMLLVTPGQLGTPLFAGIDSPHSFLAPVVEPVDVAKEIIKAVDLGISDHIAMPLYARWIDWYSILPVGLQRLSRDFAGVDKGMRTWHGRGPRRSGEKGEGEKLI